MLLLLCGLASAKVIGTKTFSVGYANVSSSATGVPETGYITPPAVLVTASGGTSSGEYPTLKDAFDKINDGTHQGIITIAINASTTESATAVLYQSGYTGSGGTSGYTTVSVYPTITGLSISGDLTAPLIDLNGADSVTIDGRVNASGAVKDLVISNINVSTTQGTSAIQFINDASANTVKYCTLKGSSTVATGGILIFGTTTGTTGNDNNTIDHNDITNAGGNRPRRTLYSIGTGTGTENSGNTISNNNFYDFLPYTAIGSGAGIYLNTYNSAWTISDNSFYETTSFAPTSSLAHYAVYVINTGNNYTINNNYIGGSAPLCEGTPWTKTNTANNVFQAIYVSTGTGTASNIQGNTIKNFNYANNGLNGWWGISLAGAGDVNIGTTAGNVIGALTGNESIVYTSISGAWYGINVNNFTGTINIRNNSIGAIKTAGETAANSSWLYCIYGSMTSGTLNIIDNTFGSATTSNSINASSPATGGSQKLHVINISTGTADCTVSGNLIANVNHAGTISGTGLSRGICLSSTSASGKLTVNNNTVRNFSNDNITASGSINFEGIYLTHTGTSAHTISGNSVYDISSTKADLAGRCAGGVKG